METNSLCRRCEKDGLFFLVHALPSWEFSGRTDLNLIHRMEVL